MATTTPVLGLFKPVVGADDDDWGAFWNSNADTLDAALVGGGPFLPLTGGTVTGPLAINTAPVMSGSSTTTPISFHNNLNVSGVAPVGMQPYNKIGVSDSLDVMTNNPGTSIDGGSANALYVIHNISGAATGQRSALLSQFHVTGTVNLGTNAFLSAFTADATSAYNCGGVSGSNMGNLCAFSYQTMLYAGATYWNLAEGFEGGCTVDPAASVAFVNGAKITVTGQGAFTSNILTLNYGGNGAAGSRPKMAIAIQSRESPRWPLDATGTIMGTQNFGADPSTCAFGIDFQAVTFSTAAFRSNGFLVDGNGSLSAAGSSTVGAGTGQIFLHVNGGNSGTGGGPAISLDFAGNGRGGVGAYSAVIGGAYDSRIVLSGYDGLVFATAGTQAAAFDSTHKLTLAAGLSVAGATTVTNTLIVNPANGITALQIQCNQNAVLPPTSFGGAITFDYSGGFGELNFFNVYPSATRSFEWHQMTSGSAATSLMTLSVGGLSLPKGAGLFGSSPPASKPTVSGSKGANAALASLLTALASYGLVLDSST
jgi:hypothetical protein